MTPTGNEESAPKLRTEAEKATAMLAGKRVRVVWRHRANEIGVEFDDGTRLFVASRADVLELSIT